MRTLHSTASRLAALAGVSAVVLTAGAFPATAASGTDDDVQVVNTETVQAYTDATGKVQSKRIYEQLALTGNGVVDLANPITTSGLRNLDGFGGFDLYYALRTKQPWTSAQGWSAGAAPAALADGTTLSGAQAGFALRFDTVSAPTSPVEVQVGLSFVSEEGAAANLAAEAPRFDFDGQRAQAAAAWQGIRCGAAGPVRQRARQDAHGSGDPVRLRKGCAMGSPYRRQGAARHFRA